MDKATGYIEKAWAWVSGRIPSGNMQDSMKVVVAYGILIAIISIAFLFAWIHNGLTTGRFDMDAMLRFFTAATSPGPVAAVTFISIFSVDKNHDGRPDAAEAKAGGNHD